MYCIETFSVRVGKCYSSRINSHNVSVLLQFPAFVETFSHHGTTSYQWLLRDCYSQVLQQYLLVLCSSLLGERIYPTGYCPIDRDPTYLRFNVLVREDAKDLLYLPFTDINVYIGSSFSLVILRP